MKIQLPQSPKPRRGPTRPQTGAGPHKDSKADYVRKPKHPQRPVDQ